MNNRERINRAMRDLDRIAQDEAISPTPYMLLLEAVSKAQEAARFALDMNERDHIATLERTP